MILIEAVQYYPKPLWLGENVTKTENCQPILKVINVHFSQCNVINHTTRLLKIQKQANELYMIQIEKHGGLT